MQLSAVNGLKVDVEGTERATLKAMVRSDFSLNKFGQGALVMELPDTTITHLKNVNVQGGTIEAEKSIGAAINFNGAGTLHCTGNFAIPTVTVNAPAQVLGDASHTATLATVTGSSSFTKTGQGTLDVRGDSSGSNLTVFDVNDGLVKISTGKLPNVLVSVGVEGTHSVARLTLENTALAGAVPGGLTVHNSATLQLGTTESSDSITYPAGIIGGTVSCKAGSKIELSAGITCPTDAFNSLVLDNDASLHLRDGSSGLKRLPLRDVKHLLLLRLLVLQLQI